jgi:hypothetical protein
MSSNVFEGEGPFHLPTAQQATEGHLNSRVTVIFEPFWGPPEATRPEP